MFVMVPQARELRRQSTATERLLWHYLCRRQLLGWRFRRQHGIGAYVVDFCCPQARLVIELDGGHHERQQGADAQRTRELQEWGYRVVRFWNHEVLQTPEAVLTKILQHLSQPPSPAGGGQQGVGSLLLRIR
jgi:very-short-patch-repair endonuclease